MARSGASFVASEVQLSKTVLAYRWGFNDLSTFNRSFKHRYGITPSQRRAGGGC